MGIKTQNIIKEKRQKKKKAMHKYKTGHLHLKKEKPERKRWLACLSCVKWGSAEDWIRLAGIFSRINCLKQEKGRGI